MKKFLFLLFVLISFSIESQERFNNQMLNGEWEIIYDENNPSNHHYSLRTKDWRYIIYDSGKEELYHNAVDPKEWNNLVYKKTHPKRDEMVKILKEITHPMVPNGLKKLQL